MKIKMGGHTEWAIRVCKMLLLLIFVLVLIFVTHKMLPLFILAAFILFRLYGACLLLIVGYSLMGRGMNPFNLAVGVPIFDNLQTNDLLASWGISLALSGFLLFALAIGIGISYEIKESINGRKHRVH